MESTSLTLLNDLRDLENKERWEEFYTLYGPLITGFAARAGCRCAQTRQDVLQETMISLAYLLPEWEYNPERGGLRSLLYTIVRNRLRSIWRRQNRTVLDTDLEGWDSGELPDNNALTDPEAVWERMWQRNLLLCALERVKQQVTPTTYESFSRYVLANRPAKHVAMELGITTNAVHQHRHRVVRLIKREIQQLCADVGEPTNDETFRY
jgi:RNA polymerase sigma factor (sigma-70 family)